MVLTAKKCLLTVVAGVAVTIAGIAINSWVGHFALASEDHIKQTHIEKLAESNAELVQQLAKRAAAEDAGTERDRLRCFAGQITSCDICGNAGVQIAACN